MADLPELHPGDCRATMAALAAVGEEFDSVVCDPPYHLTSTVKRFGSPTAAPAKHGTDGAFARQSAGFMGKRWDGGDIAFQVDTWRATFEVMKPGAYLAAFGGTRTSHRMACAIEDAGFEIRDTLMWVYGTGFPKSHDVSRAIDKAAGAERPIIGRSNRIVSEKKMREGAAGLVGSTTFAERPGMGAWKTAPGTAEAAAWEGWGTALKPAWEPIILARKPLAGTIARNVLTYGVGGINIGACGVPVDGGRPLIVSQPGESLNTFGDGLNGSRAAGETSADRWPANLLHDGSAEVLDAFGSAERARFFYCAKATKADRAGSGHPTVKPLALMRWLCRLVTPPGGRLLDPFAGSGTTLQAAHESGFAAVGCEAEPEYCDDIRRRIAGLSRAGQVAETDTLAEFFS